MSALRRNAAWALTGNLGYAACQWGVLMMVAKHASAAEVGRFALAIAITAPIVLLTNLHLRAVQATDARRTTPFATYLGLRLLSVTVAWLLIALVAVANGYDRGTTALVAAMALAKGIEALADIVFGLQQQMENLRRIALSMWLKGTGSLLVVGLVVTRTGSVVGAVLAMAAWWGIVLVTFDLRGASRLASLRPVLRPALLVPLAWLALPLGLVMGLNSFAVNVPRYAIESHLGPAALGYFAAAAYLLVAASQPILALGAALSPRLARLYHDDRAAYRRLATRGLAAGAGLGVVGIVVTALLGRQFLTVVYAPDYAAHSDLLLGLAVVSAVGFVSTALGFAVTAARRFPAQLATAVASLTLGALASTALVPIYGLVGGALALLVTELTRLTCLGAVFVRCCRVRTDTATEPAARRILHVFGSMDRGGAETRTLEIMRRLDTAAYRFDFAVLGGRPGAYAPEIAELGGTIVPCPLTPASTFPLRLFRLLRHGGYDVVHSHVHRFSGAVLLMARLAGVRTRIAHIRNSHDGRTDARGRRLYGVVMRHLVNHSATTVIGVSTSAMDGFWGPGWEYDPRRRVIYNGVEVGRFATASDANGSDASGIRRTLGITPNKRVVMHVGNFTPAKNHTALIVIADAVLARRRDVVFVLVGDGVLRAGIEAEVEARGLASFFRFTGSRDDVPALLHAAELVVLPSHCEGLPGVVLEALASGRPVIASPIAPVREIAGHTGGIILVDPAAPRAFAQAIDETLGATPTAPHAPRPHPLPSIFATETAMRRLLECYQ